MDVCTTKFHPEAQFMRKSIFFQPLLRSWMVRSVRSLYQRAERFPYEREVVIGNNTAIFSTLASIDQHKSGEHQDVTLFCPPFWLDEVHPSHLQHDWGQNIYGLPWYVRKLFLEVHPRFPEDKFISWHLYQELRQIALDKLHSHGVQIHRELPSLRREKEDIIATCKNGQNVLFGLKDTFFYNWYKVPRNHHISGLIQRSNTDLYKLDPNHLPDHVVVLGYGLSAIWLKKHFPQIQFSYLKRESDKLTTITSNFGVPYHEIENNAYNLDEITLSASSDQKQLLVVLPKENGGRAIVGDFYSAMGIRLMNELTENIIPKNQQLIVPEYHFTDWKAPENVAFGSLSENFARIMARTNNCSWAFEPMAYHLDTFPDIIKQKMFDIDITLDARFFNRFEESFVNHKAFHVGKVAKFKDSINTLKFIEFFVSTFREVYGGEYSDRLIDQDVKKIETILLDVLESRDNKRNNSINLNSQARRSYHTVASKGGVITGDRNEVDLVGEKSLETKVKLTDFPIVISTSALIEELNRVDSEDKLSNFRPINIKQVAQSLEEHERALEYSSFY